MRFRLLACDYDRTIATDGVVTEPVRTALRAVRDSGRHVVLVTGRNMEELLDVFPELRLFDRLVLENGALMLDPERNTERLLCAAVSQALLAELRRRGVGPLIVGRSVISTPVENHEAVGAAAADLGLDLALIPNVDSLMVMAGGCGKASGLAAAAAELSVELAEVVAVGDGENDVAMIDCAGIGVAVQRAVPELKEEADIVLQRPGQDGIVDLCRSLAQRDLADLLEAGAAAI
ncbi:MAG: HAD family phosphatase [Candidatus Dormibacteraeota bacterium]|nr:HAD family phosphatase [Candidatus Dormibacteraeota bacterium]